MSVIFKTINNKLKIVFLILLCLIISITICSEATNNDEKSGFTSKNAVEVFDKVLSIRVKHIDGLAKILNETDLTYLAYYYVKESPNSRMGAEFLNKIANKLDFLAGVLMIDCDDFIPKDIHHCQKDPNAKDGFPKMVLYKPPEYRFNPYTRERVAHEEIVYDKKEVSEPLIYNFVTSHIINKSLKLNLENIDSFLKNPLYNKVILFTDKAQTPLLFRGLSTFYYDRFQFGEIEKDQTALQKRFKVKSFPTLLVYVTQEEGIELDEPRLELYKDTISAQSIVMFINKFALEEKLYVKMANMNPEEIKNKITMKNLDQKNYMSFFEKFNQKRFMVYLDNNGNKDINQDDKSQSNKNTNDSHINIPEDLRKFNKLTNGFFTYVRFDCLKEGEEFCKQTFKVKSLPALILIKKSVLDENRNENFDITKRLEKSLRLSLDFENLVNELLIEFPSEMKEANPQNFPSLINNANIGKRIPMIYFYENDLPLALQLISTESALKKYIDFISFEFPSKEIQKNFQLSKLPATIFMIPDSENPGKYDY